MVAKVEPRKAPSREELLKREWNACGQVQTSIELNGHELMALMNALVYVGRHGVITDGMATAGPKLTDAIERTGAPLWAEQSRQNVERLLELRDHVKGQNAGCQGK